MNEIKDPIKYMSDECLWAIYDGVKHTIDFRRLKHAKYDRVSVLYCFIGYVFRSLKELVRNGIWEFSKTGDPNIVL